MSDPNWTNSLGGPPQIPLDPAIAEILIKQKHQPGWLERMTENFERLAKAAGGVVSSGAQTMGIVLCGLVGASTPLVIGLVKALPENPAMNRAVVERLSQEQPTPRAGSGSSKQGHKDRVSAISRRNEVFQPAPYAPLPTPPPLDVGSAASKLSEESPSTTVPVDLPLERAGVPAESDSQPSTPQSPAAAPEADGSPSTSAPETPAEHKATPSTAAPETPAEHKATPSTDSPETPAEREATPSTDSPETPAEHKATPSTDSPGVDGFHESLEVDLVASRR